MSVRPKIIWKVQLPFHFFYLLLALIGLWRAHTLWGFVLPAVSVGITAIVAWGIDKLKAGKNQPSVAYEQIEDSPR